MKTKKYKEFLSEELKNPKLAAEYLNVCMEENDPALLLTAFKDIAEAMGGMGEIAKKTKISRMTLYRALSEGGNPEFYSLFDILKAFHIQFAFKPIKKAA